MLVELAVHDAPHIEPRRRVFRSGFARIVVLARHHHGHEIPVREDRDDRRSELVARLGPGTRALCDLRPGDAIDVLGPLGNGFDLDVERPLLVAGGIGIAPMPYLAQALGDPPAILGFRSDRHAEAARLLPGATVVVEPRLVTELLPDDPHDVLACGPEPMLEAVRTLVPPSQLAWEAPMACGYGACYGCVVERDGHYVRLCIDGPVLRNAA